MFLRDQWYVAAWSDEVGNTPLARTLLGENIVLYRKTDGGVIALEDRCAHRHLPLSNGAVVGDNIQCGYHGLVYDQSGACVHIPGQDVARYSVRRYVVQEQDQFISVWMGDPDEADLSKLISFPRLSDPEWGVTKLLLPIKANYLLIVDNLLDLSHVAYVHNTTIGNAAVAEDAEVVFTRDDTKVRCTRDMYSVPVARTYADFGPEQGTFDRWQLSEFYPPAYFLINNGSGACGWKTADGGDRLTTMGEWGFQVYHGITPETETTSHQFWALAHKLDAVSPEGRAEFYRQSQQVVGEDLAIYEAQQVSLDTDLRNASAQDVHSKVAIDADRGLLHARQIIKELLQQQAHRG